MYGRFGRHLQSVAPESVAAPQAAAILNLAVERPGEPDKLDRLVEHYEVEFKLPARQPGGMFYICKATGRDCERNAAVEGQMFKLFLAPCLSNICVSDRVYMTQRHAALADHAI